MDLNAIDRHDTFKVLLDHPATGEPLVRDDNGEQMWIEVYGQDSEHYQKVDRELVEKNLAKVRRTGRLDQLNAEHADAQDVEKLAQTIAAWNVQIGGEYPEYTPKLGRDLLRSQRFIRDRIEAEQRNRSNFFGS